MSKYKEINRSVRIRCPYCGSYDSDNYGLHDKEIICRGCNKKYKMHAEVSILFTTTPNCELNAQHHKFEPLEFLSKEECNICGARREY